MHDLLPSLIPSFAFGEWFLPVMIPIVAIVMSLSIPIVAMITDYAKKRRFYELHHKERLAAIEKGVELPPLPPELFGDGPKRHPRYLLRGLVWLFIGLGALVAMYGFTGQGQEKSAPGVWLFGLIPAGVGLAYLIYYFVEGKKVEAEAAQAEAEATRKSS